MMNRVQTMLCIVVALAAASVPLLAGVNGYVVTPEPSLLILTAVGVGAVVVAARRKRGR